MTVTPFRTEEPGVVITHTDITERKQAEALVQESRESLDITLHSIGDAVIATDVIRPCGPHEHDC